MRGNRSLATRLSQIPWGKRNGIGSAKGKHQPNTRMKPNHARQRTTGFTKWELLICMATIGLLAGFLLLMLARSKAKSRRISCIGCLKQVGLSYLVWANENSEKFPWQISTNSGGTLEFVSAGKAFFHFIRVSNELGTPKILTCPSDYSRKRAVSWDQITDDSRLSYFVGVESDTSRPQTILSGDRNFSTNSRILSGLVLLKTNAPLQWAPGLHAPVGNVCLGDSSVAQLAASTRIQSAMNTNAAPKFVFP